jgi:hypothetical protein
MFESCSLILLITNRLSSFEISLMRMPYKASQHSYDVFFVARGFLMQAVRQSERHVYMPSVRCSVWPTTPAGVRLPDQVSAH